MFIQGVILGLALSAPIGIIGLWCIQRSINQGFIYGFATGLGAVIADIIFALLAALGFTKILAPLLQNNPWPSLIGAAMVVYLGIKSIIQSNFNNRSVSIQQQGSIIRAFMSSFVLILTHPAAILVFLAIFTAIGINLENDQSWQQIGLFLLGLLLGGICWWLFLAGISSLIGKKMTPNLMSKFNLISSLLIIGFGIWLGWKSFQ